MPHAAAPPALRPRAPAARALLPSLRRRPQRGAARSAPGWPHPAPHPTWHRAAPPPAGGTASGKTTVCDKLMQRLHDQCAVLLNQDSFYRCARRAGGQLRRRGAAADAEQSSVLALHKAATPQLQDPHGKGARGCQV
jgi:hypothetical protein